MKTKDWMIAMVVGGTILAGTWISKDHRMTKVVSPEVSMPEYTPEFQQQAKVARAAIDRCLSFPNQLAYYEARKELDTLLLAADTDADYEARRILYEYFFRLQMLHLRATDENGEAFSKALKDVGALRF